MRLLSKQLLYCITPQKINQVLLCYQLHHVADAGDALPLLGGGGAHQRTGGAKQHSLQVAPLHPGQNMGAAMAPAAADTIGRFLRDTATTPGDYDLIVTGDLGAVGNELCRRLLAQQGITLGGNYTDCGLLLFDRQRQDTHAGGSGCGCSAAVLCAHILPMMERGDLKRVLFCPTGALMSPTSSQQGESIPGICHGVELVAE